MKVLDSSTLIALYTETFRPEILYKWYSRQHEIVIPEAVLDEIKRKEMITYHKVEPDIKRRIITISNIIKKDELEKFRNRHPILGRGESEVLLLSLKMENRGDNKCYCVLDDGLARKIGMRYELTITGTIGLILKLRELGDISEKLFKSIIDELKSSSFRFDFGVLDKDLN